MESARKLRQPGWTVYFCGVATSVGVLYLVNLLLNHEVNIMGWYGWHIIPVGALLVGVGSGLGYALGSYWLNVKLSKAFIWGMVATALVDYVAAQYVTYLDLIERYHGSTLDYPFFQYIKDMCEGMSFSRKNSSEAGEPLGVLGYGFKLLEMAGYAFGAVIPSGVLFSMPYCRACQYYLKNRQVGYIHAPLTMVEWKKLPKPQRQTVLQQQLQAVSDQTGALLNRVAPASLDDTLAALESLQPKPRKDIVGSARIILKKCPSCVAHHLKATLINNTVAKKEAETELATVDKTQFSRPGQPESAPT